MERRMLVLVSTLVVLLAMAMLWNAFVRPGPRASASAAPAVVPAESVASAGGRPADSARDSASRAGRVVAVPPAAAPVPQSVAPSAAADGPSYVVLLARSEIRRRIRASAGITYLNDIVAASSDSVLHRWDDRATRPVRVFLPVATVANFQPAFLDAVRGAFQHWQEAGVPVSFNLDADSAAEVQVHWRIQFEGERTGQTDLLWDQDGHLTRGTITLATFDPKGQPLGADEVRVMALHEIGHLIGLDHSPDPGDIMYAHTKVHELSPRDIATALLLYELAPGPLRVGG
jgi:hypothetical protein